MPEKIDIKWDEMLAGVMKKGKAIRKRRLIIESSFITLAALLVGVYLFVQVPEKGRLSSDSFVETEQNSEVEVLLVADGAFFDNDLGLLIY